MLYISRIEYGSHSLDKSMKACIIAQKKLDKSKNIDDIKSFCEREINALLVEYCRALDCMDLDSITKLFSDECVVEFGTDEQLNSQGSKALAKSLERMWRWKRTSHHLSNVIIHFKDSDKAFSKSYVEFVFHKLS